MADVFTSLSKWLELRQFQAYTANEPEREEFYRELSELAHSGELEDRLRFSLELGDFALTDEGES